jgi:translation initiation factor 3 subunit E
VLDDPVTNFLTSLTHKFDFEEAQKQLKLCEEVILDGRHMACLPSFPHSQVLDNDVFLAPLKAAFLDRARHYIFEIYCQIHSTISIP